jgi:hypothetical protein
MNEVAILKTCATCRGRAAEITSIDFVDISFGTCGVTPQVKPVANCKSLILMSGNGMGVFRDILDSL